MTPLPCALQPLSDFTEGASPKNGTSPTAASSQGTWTSAFGAARGFPAQNRESAQGGGSHTLTGASGAQLLKEWSERVAEAQASRGASEGPPTPRAEEPDQAHAPNGARPPPPRWPPRPEPRGSSSRGEGDRRARFRAEPDQDERPLRPPPEGAPWRAGLSMHATSAATVSGLTGPFCRVGRASAKISAMVHILLKGAQACTMDTP